MVMANNYAGECPHCGVYGDIYRFKKNGKLYHACDDCRDEILDKIDKKYKTNKPFLSLHEYIKKGEVVILKKWLGEIDESGDLYGEFETKEGETLLLSFNDVYKDKEYKMLKTAEAVSKGHPDKIADQISDRILDEVLKQDKKGKTAIETLVTTGQVIVAGEMKTDAYINVPEVVRDTIKKIGYTKSEYKFTDACGVSNLIHEQSPDISKKIEDGGAGDQGIMFGGAVDETEELMPLPITLARKLVKRYTDSREQGFLKWARPDAKSQVTVRYKEDKPIGVDTVLMSVQHDVEDMRAIREELITYVIKPILDYHGFNINPTKIIINPGGDFIIGGPHGDTGLTGRKIVVDNYGGYFKIGGGAQSGKDASKVDRSGAYMARYIAKNLVETGFLRKCEVQLSYGIGLKEPLSVSVNDFNTFIGMDKSILEKAVKKVFNMKPNSIIEKFNMKKPKTYSYESLARNGHYGNGFLPWEQTDKVGELEQIIWGH